MSAYTDSVEHSLGGLEAVSTGPCPGCVECADHFGYDDVEAFTAAYEAGEVCSEGGFSWSSCGICNSHLGGNREVWHGILTTETDTDKPKREILHSSDACVDCVMYLANGEEPE